MKARTEVSKIVSGVTASQALIDAALQQRADLILVHHGFFWKGEDPCLTGMKQRRISALLANEISLLAYHLPLDAHPRLGNNAQLAQRLGLVEAGAFRRRAGAGTGLLRQAAGTALQRRVKRADSACAGA